MSMWFWQFPKNLSSMLSKSYMVGKICKFMSQQEDIRTRRVRTDASVKLGVMLWWRLILMENWSVNIFMLCWLLVLLQFLSYKDLENEYLGNNKNLFPWNIWGVQERQRLGRCLNLKNWNLLTDKKWNIPMVNSSVTMT